MLEIIENCLLLISLVNPIIAIPFFVAITNKQTIKERYRTAVLIAVAVCVITIVSTLIGGVLIKIFGISIASLQISGGIIILLIALEMLRSHQKIDESQKEDNKNGKYSVIVPLAMPILAGPLAISTIIIKSNETVDWGGKIGLIGSELLVGVIVWIVLRSAVPLQRFLGDTGVNIVTKLSGMILAAIAIEFIIRGVSIFCLNNKQLFVLS